MMKKRIAFLLIILISAVFLGCTSTTVTTTFANPDEEYCSLNTTTGTYLCSAQWTSYFDTTISLNLYYQNTDTYDVSDLYDEIGATLAHYHQIFDKYHAFEGVENIFSINQDASVPDPALASVYGKKVISEDLYDALELVLANENQVIMGGVPLFNIALSPVLVFWHDARDSSECTMANNLESNVCPIPSAEDLSASYPVDLSDVVLNEADRTVYFRKPGMGLDVGGFGKGYVSEIITDSLDARNITYILNAGASNIKAGGANPNWDDGSFVIALTKPTFTFSFTTQYFSYLRIPAGLSVVTSGSYQNYFIGDTDNRLYHHIVDPRTNYPGGDTVTLTFDSEGNPTMTPANAFMSVSIFCEDGAYGDIYSTSVYLLTLAEGLAYVESNPEIEAVWYQFDGTITLSSGLEMSEIEVGNGVVQPLIVLKD